MFLGTLDEGFHESEPFRRFLKALQDQEPKRQQLRDAANDPVALLAHLAQNSWFLEPFNLDDEFEIGILLLIGGAARLTFGRLKSQSFIDCWDYPNHLIAMVALGEWLARDCKGGGPERWVRHLSSGRRRPDGDPSREYVDLEG